MRFHSHSLSLLARSTSTCVGVLCPAAATARVLPLLAISAALAANVHSQHTHRRSFASSATPPASAAHRTSSRQRDQRAREARWPSREQSRQEDGAILPIDEETETEEEQRLERDIRRDSANSENEQIETTTDASRSPSEPSRLRGRLRSTLRSTRDRVLSSLGRIRQRAVSFRLSTSPKLVSTLSLSTTLRHIFNPSMISRAAEMPFSRSILSRWRVILRSLLPLGGSSQGNRIQVYADGDDAFAAMWAAIESAHSSVCCETYILMPDAIGVRTMQLLAAAALRGCQVTLIYDSAGSSSLLLSATHYEHVLRMEEAGVSVVQFNPILSWPWRRSFLFRDHRKILVIDERVGFTGGMNIGEEYCGKCLGGSGAFRDTHLKVEGPAVFDLLRVFHDSLNEALPSAPEPLYRSSAVYKRARKERRLHPDAVFDHHAGQQRDSRPDVVADTAATSTAQSKNVAEHVIVSSADSSSSSLPLADPSSATTKSFPTTAQAADEFSQHAKLMLHKFASGQAALPPLHEPRVSPGHHVATAARDGTENKPYASTSSMSATATAPIAVQTPVAPPLTFSPFSSPASALSSLASSRVACSREAERIAQQVQHVYDDMEQRYKYPPLAPSLGSIKPFWHQLTHERDENAVEALPKIDTASNNTAFSSPPSSLMPSMLSSWPVPSEHDDHNVFVQVLKSNVWRSSRLIQRAMVITLRAAKHRAYVTTPHLVPSSRIRRALIAAAQRGVDVRLLLAGERDDVPWARWASMHMYHLFLARGVRLYEMAPRKLHAKTVAIDGLYASIGSFNLDPMSMLNLEVNLTVVDPDIALQLEEHFFLDLLASTEVSLESLSRRTWYERCLHWVCFLIASCIDPSSSTD